MEISLSGKFEQIIAEVLKNKTKSKEEIFEVFHGVLNKLSKKHGDIKTSNTNKPKSRKRKRDIICRPALMISDSSDNEEDNN